MASPLAAESSSSSRRALADSLDSNRVSLCYIRQPYGTAPSPQRTGEREAQDRRARSKLAGESLHPVKPPNRPPAGFSHQRPPAAVYAGIVAPTEQRTRRRHMTKGQRAMAVAMIYPEPKSHVGKLSLPCSKMFLSQARTVLQFAPELADAVLVGEITPITRSRLQSLSPPPPPKTPSD